MTSHSRVHPSLAKWCLLSVIAGALLFVPGAPVGAQYTYYTPPVTLEFSNSYYTVKEGTTSSTFAVIEVRLSAACPDDVPFQCRISDGSATSGVDYKQAGTIDLKIPKTSTSVTFQIEILADGVFESEETVELDLWLTAQTPAYVSLGEIKQAILFIQDATEPPVVTFSPSPIYVLKDDAINVTSITSPPTSAAQISYDVEAYDVDGDGNTDIIASVTPGTPDTTTGETNLTIQGYLAAVTRVRALFQSFEIAQAELLVVTVDFSPTPIVVAEGGDFRLFVIVVPETARSQITFDMLDLGVATYSGSAPDLNIHGEFAGSTSFRAFLGAALARAEAVQVVKRTVDVKLDGPFVLVSPNTVPAANRPSLTLTVELKGNPGDKADITLKSAGTGAVDFEKNPLKDVTVGTPQKILVFGKTASDKRDDTKIEARMDPAALNADASTSLTVVEGVRLYFAGNFECRLATDSNKYDDKRGSPQTVDPAGKVIPGGWTFALIDEPDFDRIIRFSGPKVTRSQVPAFVPVKIKKVVAVKPKDVDFTTGDSVIGQDVNLGGNNYFYGQDGADYNPGQEPIANFKILVGTVLSGEETQNLAAHVAATPRLHVQITNSTAFSKKLLKDGLVAPAIPSAEDFFKDRKKALEKELKDLQDAGMGGTKQAKNVAFRISRLTGPYPGFLEFSNTFLYDYKDGLGVQQKQDGIKVDKNVNVTPGTSQALKLMKIRLDGANKYFVAEPSFYGYDGDALWGRVIGNVRIDNP
jgi:hypothetical protein